MPLPTSSSSPELVPIETVFMERYNFDNRSKRRHSGSNHRRTLPLETLELFEQRDDDCFGRSDSNKPSQSLVEAITRKDWTAAALRAQRRPDGARVWETVLVRGQRTSLLPLHYACTLRPPVSFIRTLLDLAPETAKAKDLKGRLPLHWACDVAGSSPEVIDLLLAAHQDGACTQECKYGFLPLHIACFWEAQNDQSRGIANTKERALIVETLIEAFPKGIWYRDKKDWLPLHIASRTGTAAVVSVLLNFPAGAKDADQDGRLPIHLACLNSGKDKDVVAIIDALVKIHPKGLRQREQRFGFLPLHIACSTPSPSERVVELLLNHYPHAAREEDAFLSSPLHVAARANAPSSVISVLVQLYPDAVRLLDRDERLPLHWACHTDAPPEVIQTLLGPYPSGLLVEESKYGYTPLHIAVHRGANAEVVTTMVSCMPQAASITDASGALPIHIVCKRASTDDLPILKRLVKAYPKGIYVKDNMERMPIDLARKCNDNEVRSAMMKMLQERRAKRRGISNALCGSKPNATTQHPMESSNSKRNDDGSDQGSDSSNPGTCVICLEHRPTHILYPCGHACLCASCATNNLEHLNNVCPIGRCKFHKAVRVFGC